MEKQQMLDQAKERLTPFETGNIVDFIQHFDTQKAMDHPLMVILFLIFGFYAFIKRSKPVLLLLFTAIAIILLVRYTLAPETLSQGLTVQASLPFALGGLAIGGAFIYLVFIKHD